MDLLYTQATGFTAFTGKLFNDIPELAAIDDSFKAIEAAGYVLRWQYAAGGENYGGDDEVRGYEIKGDNPYGIPLYLATHWDTNSGVHIFCNDPGDFFSLRLKLVINPQVVPDWALQLGVIARKAFRFSHGHDPFWPCEKCDPDEMRRLEALKKPRSSVRPTPEAHKHFVGACVYDPC